MLILKLLLGYIDRCLIKKIRRMRAQFEFSNQIRLQGEFVIKT